MNLKKLSFFYMKNKKYIYHHKDSLIDEDKILFYKFMGSFLFWNLNIITYHIFPSILNY